MAQQFPEARRQRAAIVIVAAGLVLAVALAMVLPSPRNMACITVQTTSGLQRLGVHHDYLEYAEYRRDGRHNFVAHFKWSDLSPAGTFRTFFDPDDLNRPDWSMTTTTARSHVMVQSVGNGKWPLSYWRTHRRLEMASDFPGWREVRWCEGCSSVSYIPISGNEDIDTIECAPPRTRPRGHACVISARVAGANLLVSIPLLRLKDYRLFLDRAALLMQRFREEGRKSCREGQA